ncbi:MAG: serine hydrolase [Draconibacterium sp.]|nr:serine hydrolase [Draconibacterium sp.]
MKNYSINFLMKLLCVSIFILHSTFQIVNGQTKTEQLDELLNLYTEYGQFNGSVLVSEKGEVIYKRGFGMANMEWDIPNQSNTKHRLGSITKQFTAMLILQLVEQGKLKLDVPIVTYLPDYPKPNGEKITIHHLLTHTSGIPNYTSFPNFFKNESRNPYSPEDFVKVFADSTLDFTPGEKFSYSNSGYFLLGVIIEKVTGKSYEEVLQENILIPLKMKDTGYDHHKVILKNRATGYERSGSSYINANYLDMSIPYAAGSMYSTVEDLYLWDQALYSEQILPKKYTDLLFTPYIPAFGSHYGYGWVIGKAPIGKTNDSLNVTNHGGGINGFNTIITRVPSDKNLIVLLNNTGGAPLNEMSIAISGILYNKPYDLPKKSLAYSLLKDIKELGINEALTKFNENKSTENYALREGEMNNAGYELLQAGKVKEAIEVFKINVNSFPKSANVYDSLGEAYMKDGNKDLAIENYKKSLELNPGNQGAVEMLKKMGVDTKSFEKEIIVDEKILENYVGKYELAPGFILTVSRDGNQMKSQATGQPEVLIYPKTENIFYLKVVEAQLTFNRNKDGNIESVTLHQGGQEIVGKKLLQ